MIHNVFAIFDHAAKAFLPPFCLRNEAQAVRASTDCVNSPNHQFNEHPGDYNLHHMATFDDSTGSFENLQPAPRNLGGGFLYLKAKTGPDNVELPLQQLQPKANGHVAEDIQ